MTLRLHPGSALQLVGALLMVACSAAAPNSDRSGDGGVPSPAPPPSVAVGGTSRELLVVAHQDDDLLFANPDLGRMLETGGALTIVYLTAGDDGRDASYYLERERGVQAAYSNLLQVGESSWTESVDVANGHRLPRRSLVGGGLSLLFLRLPDGNGDGNGFSASHGTPNGSLAKLWDGRLLALRVLDSPELYSRQDLIETLRLISESFQPTDLGTLDATDADGYDHSDHLHAALFAQLALPPELRLRAYRGYNITGEPPNIQNEEALSKWSAFLAYAAHDTNICNAGHCDQILLKAYSVYPSRQYVTSRLASADGVIASGSWCLDSSGVAVSAAVCDLESAVQQFVLRPDGRIVSGGLCLTASGSSAVMKACAPEDVSGLAGDAQQWMNLSSGNILSAHGLCLHAPPNGDGIVTLAGCDKATKSLWVLPFDREREVEPASSTFDVSRILKASDATTGANYLCSRLPDGIHCYGVAPSSQLTTERSRIFTDAAGWSDPRYGHSVVAADVDKDGVSDLCGCNGNGVSCAFGLGGGRFGATTRVSEPNDFPADTDSFGLADVDGDGHVDACARVGTSLRCAKGVGRMFAGSESWLEGVEAVAGDRYLFADVSHDGRADACKISKNEIQCSVTRGPHAGFARQRTWAVRARGGSLDLATIALADTDGDGDADACGVSDAGIECAKSTGSAFGAFLVSVPRPAREATWDGRFAMWIWRDPHRADACRWGAFGVTCSAPP